MKLWSKDKQKNLREFDKLWESQRPEKSKKLDNHQTKSKILGKLSQVPQQPLNFLPRSNELNKIKDLLLDNQNQRVAVTGISHPVGLQGMGGIGKSVLAAVLANDEEVRSVFPDGILWVTLGQQPKLTLRQSDLAKMLGDSSQIFQDVQQGKVYLSELLANKACLLIIDDVWKTQDAQAFNVLGQRCKMLITTRDIKVLEEVGAINHHLDLLTVTESLSLLALWAKQHPETLPPQAHQIVEECGRLPLALAMIGAMLKGKPERWQNVLYKLQNADLEKIKYQFPDYSYPDLLKAIQVSVEALEPDLQKRYLDFAVFPEDTLIPETVLQTLWELEGFDKFDTQDVIDLLVERSLIRRDEKNCLTLHDLQYDYVRKEAGDLSILHNRLLAAYSKDCSYGWYTGINDGYFFQNLAYHLRESGRKNELYTLLTQSPDWMEAKYIACIGDAAYLADLELAINHFTDPLTADDLLILVQLHTARQLVNQRVSLYNNDDLITLVWLDRESEALNHARLRLDIEEKFYGLITIYKSLHEKKTTEPELLNELWEIASLMEGLAKLDAIWNLFLVIGKNEDKSGKNNIYSELTKEFLQGSKILFEHKHKLNDACLSVKEEDLQKFFPIMVILVLAYNSILENDISESFKFFESFIKAIIEENGLDSESYFFNLVTALANAKQVEEAYRISKLIQQDWLKLKTLSQLSNILIKNQLQEQANLFLREAQEIVPSLNGSFRAEQALVELVSATAHAGDIQQAEEFLLMIEDDYLHSEALMKLSVAVAEFSNFLKAEEFIQQIEYPQIRKNALSALAAELVQSGYQAKATLLLRDIKQEALYLEDNFYLALAGLTKVLAQSNFLDEAQKVIKFISDNPEQQGYALSSLVKSLIQTGDFKQAEGFAREITDAYNFSCSLKYLAIALYNQGNTKDANRLISEALKAAKLVDKDPHRLWIMNDLAVTFNDIGKPNNTHILFLEIEKIVRNFEEIFFKIQALTILADSLYEAGYQAKADIFFTEIEKMIIELDSYFDQPFLLRRLTETLAELYLLSKAQNIANMIEDIPERIIALTSLVTAFSQNGQEAEAGEIFSIIKENYDLIPNNIGEEKLGEICTALARIRQFTDALAKMRLQKIDTFISILTDWDTAFEEIESGLSVVVFREVIRIASWVSPHWQEIYQILPNIKRN
ncbi:MAG: NB-ARC domain-containing protein [Sphaerospermopsis kisseleviana]